MVNRNLEASILESTKQFPAIAILGPRQVGKTTLAKMLMENMSETTFYLDLENPEDMALLNEPVRFFTSNQDKCIILDEIQRKPELFPLLRSVIDQHRKPARFLLLGSASSELLFMSTETLAGRILFTELSPFLFSEIKDRISVQQHWIIGGFPDVALSKNQQFRKNWYKSFFTTYVERDFRMIGLNAKPVNLSRFFYMLAHIHGNILNRNTLAKSLELNSTTITRYLEFFTRAFIIRLLEPWHINLKKRLIKSPKVYIRDSGLLHYMLRIVDINDALRHPAIGNSWEGYIIEQIIGSLGDEFSYYFYRTQDGAECDLVIVDGIKPLCSIEIKYTGTPKMTKSFTTVVNDLKTEQNFIIIPECRQAYKLNRKIQVCGLQQFIDEFQGNQN